MCIHFTLVKSLVSCFYPKIFYSQKKNYIIKPHRTVHKFCINNFHILDRYVLDNFLLFFLHLVIHIRAICLGI